MEEVFITQSKFAAIMNVSKQAVSKAVKEGRITQVIDPKDGKLKLNAEMAAAQWKKNSEVRVENSRIHEVGIVIPPAGEGEGLPEEEKESGFFKAKTKSENLKASILELKYKELSGELIPASKVEKEAFKLGRLIRENILNVPAQISNELAVESDPFEINKKLTESLTKALEDFDKLVQEMFEAEESNDDVVEDIEIEDVDEDPEEE